MRENKKRIYFANRNCSHLDCVRHDKNIPFNILILRENYKVDSNGNCKHKLLNWENDK